jgi:hypothetical protein
MARIMAMNPLTGLFLSRGSSEAQVRSLIGATGTNWTPMAWRFTPA